MQQYRERAQQQPAQRAMRGRLDPERQRDRGDRAQAGQAHRLQQFAQETGHVRMLTAGAASGNGAAAESDFRQVGSMTCGS
ncbi:hypothetical protein GCM10009090_35430 [[Pseudomonas] boreopolis]|uniref:Uncharacterized protein n=1 Tax=Xanthomonas boreopolis TaxID=86183 RepID=A0A919FBN2_9XANT|nr:hypothetical protein GCM10009090_35430 [[Pseudomonas] boreopolis]